MSEGYTGERRLFNRTPPERFVRPIAGFRGAPPPAERKTSTLHELHQPDATTLQLDNDAASKLREWENE